MEKLFFLGRENYVDYLWARYVTGASYFRYSGKLLYRDSVLSYYATQKEIDGARASADELLHHTSDVKKLEKRFASTLRAARAMKPGYAARTLRSLTDTELYERFVELLAVLAEHTRAYRQTEPHYVEHLEQEAIELIRSKTAENPYSILATILSRHRVVSAGLRLSTKDARLFTVLDRIARVRFEARKAYAPLADFSERILAEAAARCDLAINQLSNLDLQELRALLIDGITPDLGSVNKRQHLFALEISTVRGKTVVRDLPDAEVKKLIRYDEGNAKLSELTGQIGYPGRVIGTARVAPLLSEPKEYDKYVATLKETDVLVAPMTGPGLTPAFTRVAAVVTDEGGLMSHAALVAREQKLPCIIGTRLATKTFRDGEEILVDAVNGIVQKYHKNSV